MAFLTKEGKIYTVGDFIEDEGILYSNYTYDTTYGYYRNLGKVSAYGAWDDDDWGNAPFDNSDDCMYLTLSWLKDSDYVKNGQGELRDGLDFLIGLDGTLYEYDYGKDIAIEVHGLTAYTEEGLPKRFDEDNCEPIAVSIYNEIMY